MFLRFAVVSFAVLKRKSSALSRYTTTLHRHETVDVQFLFLTVCRGKTANCQGNAIFSEARTACAL